MCLSPVGLVTRHACGKKTVLILSLSLLTKIKTSKFLQFLIKLICTFWPQQYYSPKFSITGSSTHAINVEAKSMIDVLAFKKL